MGTNWKTEQAQGQHLETRPHHYCERCSEVRLEEDPVCLSCEVERPSQGWARLEDAFDPFLGRVLNERYLITKIEGRGASSTIYRAESQAVPRGLTFNKRFAIKMVKLWHADQRVTEEVRTRLEREVRAVGMLRNPHIVRVYELLELDQNWIALVMDHIDGQTVEERVETQGPLSVGRACALMRQVANGLCEAHDVGMIHRDIKPANIMLELLPDGHDFAFLLDFGVVHLEGEAKVTHGFLGTPLFASPEQATSAEIDRRSDIYSLGATFFYMLTGHAPFESERTLEVLEAHVKKRPPRLSQVCPERSFPPVIETLVAKMLAKSPADRPVSLYEVLEALRGIKVTPTSTGRPQLAQQEPAQQEPAQREPAQREPAQREPAQRESTQLADLDSHLGIGDSYDGGDHAGPVGTTAFQDRPKTMLGIRHAVEILPNCSALEPPAFEPSVSERVASERVAPDDRDQKRARWRKDRDSRELSSIRETNPGSFSRRHTRPKSAHLERGQTRRTRSEVGIAFARNVRQVGACSEKLIAFVDSHNEVWTVGDNELFPVATPLSRVCSVSASDDGAYVGLADGSISHVLPNRQGLELLLCDDDGRPITAMAATRESKTLLAGTADGTLYLGRLDQRYERWLSLHANRGIAAIALTPGGEAFAAASIDGFVRVAATDTPGSAIAKLVAGGHVCDMAFCNDGYLLAILLDSGRIPIFQVLDARQVSVLTPDCPTPQSMYFSRENVLYGVSSSGGRITRWNLTTGRAAQLE